VSQFAEQRGGPHDGRPIAYADETLPPPYVDLERVHPEQPAERDPELGPRMQKGRYRRRQVYVYEWEGWA